MKAQLKMMESILVLIIFFFLLVFSLAFYAGFSKVAGKKKIQEATELNVMQLSQRVQYMPELQCTKDGTEVVADCFDLIKIEAFKSISNSTRYKKLYSNLLLEVNTVYPRQGNTIIINNKPNEDKLSLEVFHLPITVFDPVSTVYSIGYITIGVYYV